MSLRALYDLNGARLAVSAEDERRLAPFERVLAPLRTMSGAPDVTATVRRGDPDAAAVDLPLAWEGVLPEGLPARWFAAGERSVLISPQTFRLDLDREAGRAAIVSTDAGATAKAPVVIAADAALGARQMLLHAACLRLPSAAAAVLLFGASGRGKTTTALALALGGFALATDDASIVRRAAAGWQAWGLPRPVKVHHRTLALLPRLGRTADTGEVEIPLAALTADAALAGTAPMPLAALLFLADRAEKHALDRLSPAEAMLACATDNVGNSMLGVLPAETKRFARIADLCRSLPSYRLVVGRSLGGLAGFLQPRLDR